MKTSLTNWPSCPHHQRPACLPEHHRCRAHIIREGRTALSKRPQPGPAQHAAQVRVIIGYSPSESPSRTQSMIKCQRFRVPVCRRPCLGSRQPHPKASSKIDIIAPWPSRKVIKQPDPPSPYQVLPACSVSAICPQCLSSLRPSP